MGRELGHIVSKCATLTRIKDVSPQDLRHHFGYVMAEKDARRPAARGPNGSMGMNKVVES